MRLVLTPIFFLAIAVAAGAWAAPVVGADDGQACVQR